MNGYGLKKCRTGFPFAAAALDLKLGVPGFSLVAIFRIKSPLRVAFIRKTKLTSLLGLVKGVQI